MTEPVLNSTATAQMVVGDSDLASALPMTSADAFPSVFATARMVALMEIASARLLHSCLGTGELSVGVSVDITHTAPTPKGAAVMAQARYISGARESCFSSKSWRRIKAVRLDAGGINAQLSPWSASKLEH